MQMPNATQLKRYHQSGFTLIELLIVIAIIGILAAIGVPQYSNYLDRSATTACVAELSSFRSVAVAESASGTQLITGESGSETYDDSITNFDFESCDIQENSVKGQLAQAFANGTAFPSNPVSVSRSGANGVNVENGQISID